MNVPLPSDSQDDILLVDDTPNNLRLLSGLLKEKGYDVRAVISGRMAITAAQASPPALVLLDISMPEMNGYEVCRQLKTDERTRHIPVIFISALDDVFDKVKAFDVGGVDYITKPFQVEEVLARVKLHLTLQKLQRQMQQQNAELQEQIRERQQAEEKYRSVLENAIEGFFQTNVKGQYLTANPALVKIYGYDSIADLMTNLTADKLYVRHGRRAELQAYLSQYGVASDFESQVYCKDGKKIWISENIRVVNDEAGNLLYYEGMVQDITERRQTEAELYRQRQETERLLLSIMPQSIAERLKRRAVTIADSYPMVTVLFADIVDFTQLSTRVAPSVLVESLNQIFSEFDRLAELYGLEKIKTIGDEYMVAGGLPDPKLDHADAVAELALTMQQSIVQFQSDLGEPFQLRIGINSGPVVAGVIGTKKLTYDLWGETVNLASRMQSQGIPGKIQVAPGAYQLLRDRYQLEERGQMDIKGFGRMHTYWLTGRVDPIPHEMTSEREVLSDIDVANTGQE
jgi:PAS domain S-box-containing protein